MVLYTLPKFQPDMILFEHDGRANSTKHMCIDVTYFTNFLLFTWKFSITCVGRLFSSDLPFLENSSLRAVLTEGNSCHTSKLLAFPTFGSVAKSSSSLQRGRILAR